LVAQRRVRDSPRKIFRLKFWTASKSFDVFDAAISGVAAVQHGWRDFRIA